MRWTKLLGLGVLSLLTAGGIQAADDCKDSNHKAAAEPILRVFRLEVRDGARNFLLSSALLQPVLKDSAEKIAERVAQKVATLLIEPEYAQKQMNFVCANLTDEELRQLFTDPTSPAGLRKILSIKEGLRAEVMKSLPMWIALSLHELQGEFTELNRPDELLQLGGMYARGHLWDYATESFQKILDADTRNAPATEWMGMIWYGRAGETLEIERFDRALQYFRKLAEIESQAPEAHYWMGTIDWTVSFNGLQELRAVYQKNTGELLKYSEPLPVAVRNEFDSGYRTRVDDGIEHLQKALQLAPSYGEAGVYLSLLYRLKASRAATKAEFQKFQNMADTLVTKFASQAGLRPKRPARPDPPPPPPPPPPPTPSKIE